MEHTPYEILSGRSPSCKTICSPPTSPIYSEQVGTYTPPSRRPPMLTPAERWAHEAGAQVQMKRGSGGWDADLTTVLLKWVGKGAPDDALKRHHLLHYKDPWMATERAIVGEAVALAGMPPLPRRRRPPRWLLWPDYRLGAALVAISLVAGVINTFFR